MAGAPEGLPGHFPRGGSRTGDGKDVGAKVVSPLSPRRTAGADTVDQRELKRSLGNSTREPLRVGDGSSLPRASIPLDATPRWHHDGPDSFRTTEEADRSSPAPHHHHPTPRGPGSGSRPFPAVCCRSLSQ
ncbi:hypothetical protein AGIG_G21708 [Arapaima gigas]